MDIIINTLSVVYLLVLALQLLGYLAHKKKGVAVQESSQQIFKYSDA